MDNIVVYLLVSAVVHHAYGQHLQTKRRNAPVTIGEIVVLLVAMTSVCHWIVYAAIAIFDRIERVLKHELV